MPNNPSRLWGIQARTSQVVQVKSDFGVCVHWERGQDEVIEKKQVPEQYILNELICGFKRRLFIFVYYLFI